MSLTEGPTQDRKGDMHEFAGAIAPSKLLKVFGEVPSV